MILKLYQVVTYLAGPLIDVYLHKRMQSGKEDPKRIKERLGHAALPRPEGPLVWVHAASVGEALSVLPIINRLSESYEEINFLLTTGTTTSAKLIESRLPDKSFHQYVPIDRINIVRRFLRHWQPNLALWVESELWPNLVTETGKYCSMILINGRMSDESFRKWQRYRSLGQQVIGKFSLTLPQSKHDAERFEKLGARSVKYVGNIKFDAPPLPSDSQKMGELLGMIGQRPVWMAASTHEGEEEMIAQIHADLKEEHPELLTIIAPRHPKRAAEILDDISNKGLNIAQRSADQVIDDDTDIYLADTLGELGVLYRLVSVVFVGGSLVEKGGQNPLEAARLDCAVVYGPNMDNFMEIKHDLENNAAAICVKDKEDLKEVIADLIVNHEKQAQLATAALEVVKEKAAILDAFVAEITPYVEKISTKTHEAA